MAAHEGLHEAPDKLSTRTMNLHRAIVSMIEELEAVDWYQQRVDAGDDDALSSILAHHRDEELEHFAMLLEYVRRLNPVMDKCLRTYLFKEGDIRTLESAAESESSPAPSASTSAASESVPDEDTARPPKSPSPSRLTVGSLRNRRP